MQNIRVIAREYGLKTSGIKKQDLIRQIQVAEGNFDCFSTAIDGECDQAGCLWRDDCLKSSTDTSH
ncbi:hypothetical protein [Kaarinaea lacus]